MSHRNKLQWLSNQMEIEIKKNMLSAKEGTWATRVCGVSARYPPTVGAVFYFYIFIFIFTKIYFRFRNLQEYTPAAPLRGGRGFSAKISRIFLQKSPWRTGRPAAGRPAPQAAQQRGGGPRLPGSRATGSPALI